MARPDYMKNCTKDCERRVECAECGRIKAPSGRSIPEEMYGGMCPSDCPGYDKEPKPGHLWPGELADIDGQEDLP